MQQRLLRRTKSDPPHDPPDFAKFYSAYPKKQGKAQARREFAKLAPDAKLLAEMIAAVDRQGRATSGSGAVGSTSRCPATG